MIRAFRDYIVKNKLFEENGRILLALSGGVDSVVLADLLARSGYPFGIAHCNFGLRGSESDQDEAFVRELATVYQLPCHTRRFNTEEYAGEKKISIQMAARELRYEWFEEIREKNRYDVVATAHHRDDMVETVLINLTRGTGFKGLQGIRPRHGNLVRPLLFASRLQIETYATSRKLRFRVDSSNSETKYLRNRIRLEIIPLLRSLNPSFDESIVVLAAQCARIGLRWDKEVTGMKELAVTTSGDRVSISIPKLLDHPNPRDLLWELVQPFGFTSGAAGDIHTALKASSGKKFFSGSHQLLKDRDSLIITPLPLVSGQQGTRDTTPGTASRVRIPGQKHSPGAASRADEEQAVFHVTNGKASPLGAGSPATSSEFYTSSESAAHPVVLNFQVHARTGSFVIPTDPGIACFDHDKLKFPLTARKWTKGDHFFPLGMRKPKKLSDFFVDNKISRIDKENAWLLLSGHDIIWVIGYRIDHRYRITGKTKQVLMVTATG